MDVTELVTIGKIVKPFGIRGEVRVQSLSDVPGRWERVEDVVLVAPSGHTCESKVRHLRVDGRSYIVAFEGMASPEEASMFRGAWIKVPRSEVPRLSDGQFYEFELIGLAVMDEGGQGLGVVSDVVETGAHHVLVVQGQDQEILIPATRQVVGSVDLDAGTIVVRRDQGLVASS